MYARLLTLTRTIQLAAVQAVLRNRTVIRLGTEDWNELITDPEFAKGFNGGNWCIMNDVLVQHNPPRAERVAPVTVRGVEHDQSEFERAISSAMASDNPAMSSTRTD